jgi:hypothetical protein
MRISDNFVLLKYRAIRLNITIHAGLSIPMIPDYFYSAGRKENSHKNAYGMMILNAKRAIRNVFGKIA